MKPTLAAVTLFAGLLLLPGIAAAVPCPGGGPDVRVVSRPGLPDAVRPVWRADGPVVLVDPAAGGYRPELFARQVHQFLLMHGLAHVCRGHVTAAMAARFERDADYTGWRGPRAELEADCWAARQLAARRSAHVARAAAVMFDGGDGAFAGRADNPPSARRAARIRRCAGLE